MAVTLTEGEKKVLSLAWQCFQTPPKVDYKKLQELGGYKNSASATSVFLAARKKLLSTSVGGGGGGGATYGGGAEAVKKSSKKRSAAAAAAAAGAEGEDDDEAATPSKRGRKGKAGGARGAGGLQDDAEEGCTARVKVEIKEEEEVEEEMGNGDETRGLLDGAKECLRRGEEDVTGGARAGGGA